MARPFDLLRGVFRALILSTPDDGLTLLVVMHHIVSDGTTLENRGPGSCARCAQPI